jgi:hypothetical protein
MRIAGWPALLAMGVLLAGCVGRDGPNPDVRVLDSAGGGGRGPLSDDAIRQSVSGKTFQYTRADGNGIITFNADGTSELVDDSKGAGTGSWRADGGRLCESLNPSDAAPDGREEICQAFSSTGDAYYAGKARFVAM